MIAWFGAMLALSVAVQDTVRDTTGTVAGTVRDTAGKPIPGATVRISLHQYTRTDSIGRYVLSEIQPGPVQLSAASLGYERVGRSGVVVSPGIITHVDLVMPDGPRGPALSPSRARRAQPPPAEARASRHDACPTARMAPSAWE
jgi:Carboxypeptidase regulatory-like domain